MSIFNNLNLHKFLNYFAVFIFSCICGIFITFFYRFYFSRVKVDTTRVEKCLHAYIEYKKHNNESQLVNELSKINITKFEFEQIIDRFIQYRINKSALNQAKKLFSVMKLGDKIYPKEVINSAHSSHKKSLQPSLELEILAVLTYKPELVEKAFGS